jgi:hypothetical protein
MEALNNSPRSPFTKRGYAESYPAPEGTLHSCSFLMEALNNSILEFLRARKAKDATFALLHFQSHM